MWKYLLVGVLAIGLISFGVRFATQALFTDTQSVASNTFTTAASFGGTSMRLATGTYTGDGIDNRQITGVGFQPDVVIIKVSTNTPGVIRTSTMVGDASKPLTLLGTLQPDLVQSLDANGFTVGTDTGVNQSLHTYYWVAMKAGSELKLGTYVGDGADNRSIIGMGFQPTWVITLGDGDDSVFRPGTIGGDNSFLFDGRDPLVNLVQTMEADGFQIGAGQKVNEAGTTFHI